MAATSSDGQLASSQSNASDISLPSYSMIEDANGQLVSCTNEKVIWPNRPLTGKYSLMDELSARRKRHKKKSPPKEESTLHRMSSTSILPPSIKPGRDVYELPTSILCSPKSTAVLWDTSSPTISDFHVYNRLAGDTYALLGKCARDDAVQKLGNRWNAVLFYDENEIYLGVLLNGVKYVMSIKEVSFDNGEPGWGISWFGDQPEMVFHDLKKLTHFYSFAPAAAFYELSIMKKSRETL